LATWTGPTRIGKKQQQQHHHNSLPTPSNHFTEQEGYPCSNKASVERFTESHCLEFEQQPKWRPPPKFEVAEDKDDDDFFERSKIGSSFSIGNCENPIENELYI
jgi:hypothetical protein